MKKILVRKMENFELEILPNELWSTVNYVDYKSGKEVVDEKLMISSCGRVLSLKSEIPTLITPQVQNAGYQIIKVGNVWKTLHRVVAHLFLDKPVDGINEVDHIDGNKLNNCAANLQWISHKSNLEKRIKAEIRKKDMIIDYALLESYYAKKDDITDKVFMYDLNGCFVCSFPSVRQAALATGSSSQLISQCLNGSRLLYRGHIWLNKQDDIISVMKRIKEEVLDTGKTGYHIYNNKDFDYNVFEEIAKYA